MTFIYDKNDLILSIHVPTTTHLVNTFSPKTGKVALKQDIFWSARYLREYSGLRHFYHEQAIMKGPPEKRQ